MNLNSANRRNPLFSRLTFLAILSSSVFTAPTLAATICEDTYQGACFHANGKSKYPGGMEIDVAPIRKTIVEIRERTAASMGYKSFAEGLRAQLVKAGLELRDDANLEEAVAAALDAEPGKTAPFGGLKNLYAAFDRCLDSRREIARMEDPGEVTDPKQITPGTDPGQLNAIVSRQKALIEEIEKSIGRIYAQYLPVYYLTQASKCEAMRKDPERYPSEYNLEIFGNCRRLKQFEREATNLYQSREAKGDAYRKLAEDFIRDHHWPELVEKPDGSDQPDPRVNLRPIVRAILPDVQKNNARLAQLCSFQSSAMTQLGQTVLNDFTRELNLTPFHIEAMLDEFYPASRKAHMDTSFRKIVAEAVNLSNTYVKDPAKRAKIASQYSRMRPFWLEKPSAAAYTVKNGRKVLDKKKAENPFLTGYGRMDLYTVMSDPSLSFFTTPNAEYLPSMNVGAMASAETVLVMPAILTYLEKNPLSYLAVIAHEIGHKIDPQVSKLNGYNLAANYKPLLQCLQEPDSIGLLPEQIGEAIADSISAEILAKQVRSREDLEKAMEVFCKLDQSAPVADFSEVHPDITARVSGIFGANPSLRAAAGCEIPPAKYRTCGIRKDLSK